MRILSFFLVASTLFAGFNPPHAGVSIHGVSVHTPAGSVAHSVPATAITYTHGGASWYYHEGHWITPHGWGFRYRYPPCGLCIPFLPVGYMTFWFGGVPYYYYEGVYYISDVNSPGYMVTVPPPLPPIPEVPSTSESFDALILIPLKGQSVDQMVQDRKEAQAYASERTGFDPNHLDANDPGIPRARAAYQRCVRAYLEGKGYNIK